MNFSNESSEDDDFAPRGSSSQLSQSQNSTRNSNRSPERRSARNLSTSRQQQQSTGNRNQAGSSRGQGTSKNQVPTTSRNQASTSAQQQPVGAAKRKAKKPTVKSHFKTPLQQIRFLQTHVENLIPKSPFCRLVKEILHSHGDYRMTKDSLDALQEASEAYLVGIFDDGFRLTLHRNRVTIQPTDIQLLLYLRGGNDPGVP